jgi:hypothetical protein
MPHIPGHEPKVGELYNLDDPTRGRITAIGPDPGAANKAALDRFLTTLQDPKSTGRFFSSDPKVMEMVRGKEIEAGRDPWPRTPETPYVAPPSPFVPTLENIQKILAGVGPGGGRQTSILTEAGKTHAPWNTPPDSSTGQYGARPQFDAFGNPIGTQFTPPISLTGLPPDVEAAVNKRAFEIVTDNDDIDFPTAIGIARKEFGIMPGTRWQLPDPRGVPIAQGGVQKPDIGAQISEAFEQAGLDPDNEFAQMLAGILPLLGNFGGGR